jgi:hypothetical protein
MCQMLTYRLTTLDGRTIDASQILEMLLIQRPSQRLSGRGDVQLGFDTPLHT